MTIDTMITLFDLIQDKPNSVYFDDAEKLEFLNRAQVMFLSEYNENNFPGDIRITERGFISTRSLENTLGNTDILRPLVVGNMTTTDGVTPITTDSNGNLLNSTIETAIGFNSGQTTPVLKLLSMALSDDTPLKYVRHNDLYKFINNDFLSPTNAAPLYCINNDGYQVYPQAVHMLIVSVVRQPVPMVFIAAGNPGNVSCELDDFTHDRILAIALEQAGVASRDSALVNLRDIINHQDRV
jgi:hypothetical protein